MICNFKPGDRKIHLKKVTTQDVAHFESGTVHEVCSTFALAREIEWASRLFVLDMKEPHEEGIGTMLHIEHKSPALPGEVLEITAIFETLEKNALTCSVIVKVHHREIAFARTAQKIIQKSKMTEILKALQEHEQTERPNSEDR